MKATADPALRAAEDELQIHRARTDLIAGFIHNPVHDRDARIALARLLGLPTPGNDTRRDASHGG